MRSVPSASRAASRSAPRSAARSTSLEDPFCRERAPDDHGASIDHFYTKLLNLADTMQTGAGRREAARRTAFLESFITELESEIAP